MIKILEILTLSEEISLYLFLSKKKMHNIAIARPYYAVVIIAAPRRWLTIAIYCIWGGEKIGDVVVIINHIINNPEEALRAPVWCQQPALSGMLAQGVAIETPKSYCYLGLAAVMWYNTINI